MGGLAIGCTIILCINRQENIENDPPTSNQTLNVKLIYNHIAATRMEISNRSGESIVNKHRMLTDMFLTTQLTGGAPVNHFQEVPPPTSSPSPGRSSKFAGEWESSCTERAEAVEDIQQVLVIYIYIYFFF